MTQGCIADAGLGEVVEHLLDVIVLLEAVDELQDFIGLLFLTIPQHLLGLFGMEDPVVLALGTRPFNGAGNKELFANIKTQPLPPVGDARRRTRNSAAFA